MTTGLVFDIREFAVHDGPGIRTTVFLKGCPLSCTWCHNPEGQSSQPQIMRSPGRERLAGTRYTAKALASILNRQAAVFKANEGGVTFSGGEPLMQADFLAEVIDRLDGIHVLLDTSGWGNPNDFRLLLERSQLVFYDLKIIDRKLHQTFTGCDNDLILDNLLILAASGVPYVIRVPLVPGVTDTPANLGAIARTVGGLKGLIRVDLLAYNRAAGAKYTAAGMIFKPGYNETQPINQDLSIFENAGIKPEGSMNERIEAMKLRVRRAEHHLQRREKPINILEECQSENLSWAHCAARLTRRQCEAETVVIAPDERIVFTRTLPAEIPALYTPTEMEQLIRGRTLHELGPINNICADWGQTLSQGLLGRREVALKARQRFGRFPGAAEFLDCAVDTIDAVLELAERYAAAAREMGKSDVADALSNVPSHRPRTFHEALQSLRLLHAVVWLSGHYHVGLGRLDQYLWPYLSADLAAGRLDIASAEELLAEFFISLNKDSDLYPGVQQGDNGQTITLGGVDREGKDAVNELTRMALRVSRDLALIDPKINLRITPQSDLDLLSLASELTRRGLGFPQYSNDDVVIPALAAHGYRLKDARDYAVAACWEFLIPGRGMEVVNIGAVSFPAAVDEGLRAGVNSNANFDCILDQVSASIQRQTTKLVKAYDQLWLPPAPYYSVLMTECLEQGKDLSQGTTYNNFGIHGAGSANAADALAAVRQFVFDDQSLSATDLVSALDGNFSGAEDLRSKLANGGPKVGRNSDLADEMLTWLFDRLADACESVPDNRRGGMIRPGTGSAMYYVWLAQGHDGMREPVVGATADGRHQGDFFSANLAPAPGVQVNGPISIFQSFAKINYKRICNGGPITIELSDSVFRDPESIRKVAMLVRTFADLGCQQLQLNSLNPETLLDAKAHPERHQNLIVRVWGWSGYFCELAPEYQDHIINRSLYQ